MRTAHPGGVTWVHIGQAEGQGEAEFCMDRLSVALRLLRPEARLPGSVQEGVEAVKDALPARSLLVLDDVWELEHARPLKQAALAAERVQARMRGARLRRCSNSSCRGG